MHSKMSENNLVLFSNIKKSCQNDILQEKIWNLNRKPREIILKQCHTLQTDGSLGNDLWNAIARKSYPFVSRNQCIESVNIDDLQVDDEETSDNNNDDDKHNENENKNQDGTENDKNNEKNDKNHGKPKNNPKSSSKHNLISIDS